MNEERWTTEGLNRLMAAIVATETEAEFVAELDRFFPEMTPSDAEFLRSVGIAP